VLTPNQTRLEAIDQRLTAISPELSKRGKAYFKWCALGFGIMIVDLGWLIVPVRPLNVIAFSIGGCIAVACAVVGVVKCTKWFPISMEQNRLLLEKRRLQKQ
jgi:hypothetical protein